MELPTEDARIFHLFVRWLYKRAVMNDDSLGGLADFQNEDFDDQDLWRLYVFTEDQRRQRLAKGHPACLGRGR